MPRTKPAHSLTFLARRALRAGPRATGRRFRFEARGRVDRWLAPGRERGVSGSLLRSQGATSIDQLWDRLARQLYLSPAGTVDAGEYDQICPGDRIRILAAADRAMKHEINFLGSGPVRLGAQMDWQRDYKTGWRWPVRYYRDIKLADPDHPSDVKMPWELSRMQWLIPVGQAYALTGDERYAMEMKRLLLDWMDQNPYAHSVNWRIAMEPAMRVFTWTWLFHVFAESASWAEPQFRERFLRCLHLHGDFVHRHIEHSEVNGNHCVADAAALVVLALFFGQGRAPRRWLDHGWRVLNEELPRQVLPDGVDFEGSVPYHRLALELFLLPALYRERVGLTVPAGYSARVIEMARFAAAYSREHGTIPLIGDADDGRVLPFGGQERNDHRYLAGLVGVHWQIPDLIEASAGSRAEAFWLLGAAAAGGLPATETPSHPPGSRAFRHAGFYLMRGPGNHVFVDCGPVGMAGRGGHGHNDCLSFEAVLDGVPLISDCGSYVYMASIEQRNAFRSTLYHNTPCVDGEELNRFVAPQYLWLLQNDALPQVRRWEEGGPIEVLVGAHTGYRRLARPVTPVRTLALDHQHRMLMVHDEFEGSDEHRVEIPLHFAPGVEIADALGETIRLQAGSRNFVLRWDDGERWKLRVTDGRISPSYGVLVPCLRLAFQAQRLFPLTVFLAPETSDAAFTSAADGLRRLAL